MAGVPHGLARYLDKLVLAACVLVSASLLSMGETSKVQYATRWAHWLTTPVEWSARVLDKVASLRAENQELKARLAALELDSRQIAAQRQRLGELEARAGFYQRNRGRLAPAVVLEVIVSRIPVQAKIRVTGDDTLRVWQPVVTEAGLVGRVRQVLGRDLALVQLLTDEESRISVEAVRNGVTGLLRYDGREFLLDHVPQGDPLRPGDELVTSGLGGSVPRGIPIGAVLDVRSTSTELFQQVVVSPGVRFSALSQVYVVTRPGPWYAAEPQPRASGATPPSKAQSATPRSPAADRTDPPPRVVP
jgi:rod shape-determining protein MreC